MPRNGDTVDRKTAEDVGAGEIGYAARGADRADGAEVASPRIRAQGPGAIARTAILFACLIQTAAAPTTEDAPIYADAAGLAKVVLRRMYDR